MKRTFFVLVVIVIGILGGQAGIAHASTGQIFPMSSSTNWNVRFDGPVDTGGLTGALSYGAVATGDLCGNGEQDLVVGARRSDLNGRQDSGSLYVICNNVWSSFSGTGNILNLASSTSYNLRIDGASADDAGGRSPVIADVDGDGEGDLLFSNYGTGYNGKPDSGSVYVLYHTLLQGHTGSTGNILDLATSTSYNLRFDGDVAGGNLVTVRAGDLDNDDLSDLVMVDFGDAKFFVVYHSLFGGSTGTGNIFNLASSTSYNLKYSLSDSGGEASIATDNMDIKDMNGDGENDLMFSSLSPYNGFYSGSLYLIYNDLLQSYGSSTGIAVDIASSTNFNVRFDGSYLLGYNNIMTEGDLDGDGNMDIVVSDAASNNGRSTSGSTYVIYHSIFDNLVGTGNILSLANPASFNLRYDGPSADTYMVSGAQGRIADLDNDGRNDLVIDTTTDINLNPGNIYVIFNSLLDDYSGTGNTIDLASSANWNFRYDGANSGDWLGGYAMELVDIDGNGGKDAVLGAWGADFSGPDTGSLYLIYYFPHEITLDPVFTKAGHEAFDVTGSVEAPDSVTDISLVQWGHERSFGNASSSVFTDIWHDCAASDGTFDSTSEDFTCHHEALDIDEDHASPHTVFFRAQDSKGVWTATSSYPTETYTHDSPISEVKSSVLGQNVEVTWETDEPGSSFLAYGTTPGVYTVSTTEIDTSPRVTSHTVSLSSLACTTFYYQVHSKDIAENEATSEEHTFLTCPVESHGSGGGGGGSGSSGGSRPTPSPSPTPSPTPSSTPSPTFPGSTAGPGGSPSTPTPLPPFRFLSNLREGMTHPDVLELQRYLNAHGFLLAQTGPGSPGLETSYFGGLTKAALIRLQEAHAAEILTPLGLTRGTGYFGERTRAFLNKGL